MPTYTAPKGFPPIHQQWSPSRNDADAARLLQALWASGRFSEIQQRHYLAARTGEPVATVELFSKDWSCNHGGVYRATESDTDAPAAMRLAIVKACIAACTPVEATT